MKRRRVFLGATGVLTGLAGCSTPSSDSRMLDLTIFSHADDPYTVEVGVFRDESSRSDARVYSASLDVPSEGRAERENVLEARPYLVRYSAYRDNSRLTDEGHVHYLPPEDGEAGLTFDIDSDGSLTRR